MANSPQDPKNSPSSSKDKKVEHHHHHILTTRMALTIGITLMILTLITVWVAGIDLGHGNFLVAMIIATVKGLLVALFFMNLFYDHRENGVIFGTSFIFLAIFIILTSTDLFFRGDVYVKPGALTAASTSKSKLSKPWVSTPELIAHGKELFMVQCTPCHGPEGKGNGPAAAALNPPPRNFTSGAGWVNGRRPSNVFKTLRDGVAGSGMASFATLPSDDRWSLAHYVLSIGPPPETDTAADLAKIGIDPNKEGGGEKEAPTIPVELAMQLIAQANAAPPAGHGRLEHAGEGPGSDLYRNNCASCHGAGGEGGVRVRNLGVDPAAWVTTQPFVGAQSLASSDSFSHVVTRGLPGNIMPGYGELSASDMHELYDYVRSMAAR